MRRITKAAAAVVLTAGTMAALGTTTAQATTAAAAYHGCPSGDVCVYPVAGWNGDSPLVRKSDEGTIISTGHSVQRILNNRTDSTPVRICESAASCTAVPSGTYNDYHFSSSTYIEVGD